MGLWKGRTWPCLTVTVYLTREGFKRLDDELEHLRTVKRPEVSERIRRSKDMTDVDGNAEYDEAKSEQGFIEGRIVELERALAERPDHRRRGEQRVRRARARGSR